MERQPDFSRTGCGGIDPREWDIDRLGANLDGELIVISDFVQGDLHLEVGVKSGTGRRRGSNYKAEPAASQTWADFDMDCSMYRAPRVFQWIAAVQDKVAGPVRDRIGRGTHGLRTSARRGGHTRARRNVPIAYGRADGALEVAPEGAPVEGDVIVGVALTACARISRKAIGGKCSAEECGENESEASHCGKPRRWRQAGSGKRWCFLMCTRVSGSGLLLIGD